jgi:GAF domain-containing protein
VTATAGIAAYVGIPIALVDGTVYGTLCVASHRPRGELTERDVAFLQGIARRVADKVADQRVGDAPAATEPGPS